MALTEKSLPARVAWIEIVNAAALWNTDKSLPARVAWIEIYRGVVHGAYRKVATREGSVD